MIRPILVCLALAASSGAFAQSLSVEDIRAQIAAERDAPNPYADLLADPDPEVAHRAMEIMLEQGDEELRRLALEFGVHSPQPEVRHQALGAWLASRPRIEFVFENAGASAGDFASLMTRAYGTAPNAKGQSIWIVQLVGLNAEQECYPTAQSSRCLLRHTANGTWILKNGIWQEVGLNDAGEFAGTFDAQFNAYKAKVSFRVPVP